MKTQQKIYGALVVMVLVGGLVYLQNKKSQEHVAMHTPPASSSC